MSALWHLLTTPPAADDVLTPFSAIYLVVFLSGFLASAFLVRSRCCSHSAGGDLLTRLWPCARLGVGVSGAGLVFFAVRALQINPLALGAPIWMIAAVVALFVGSWRCLA